MLVVGDALSLFWKGWSDVAATANRSETGTSRRSRGSEASRPAGAEGREKNSKTVWLKAGGFVVPPIKPAKAPMIRHQLMLFSVAGGLPRRRQRSSVMHEPPMAQSVCLMFQVCLWRLR
uniref:Uncharacterized protein n=1 Tax=Steinernema glaseri TaxID=37863 RepID=A0A1I7ZU80_9BILA